MLPQHHLHASMALHGALLPTPSLLLVLDKLSYTHTNPMRPTQHTLVHSYPREPQRLRAAHARWCKRRTCVQHTLQPPNGITHELAVGRLQR